MRVNVNIEYKLGRKTGAMVVDHPTGWSDCTSAELTQFINRNRDKDANTTRILLLKDWLKIPDKVFSAFSSEQILAMLELNQWVFEEMGLSKWLFKFIELDKVVYYGPEDRLKNITISEFAIADMSFISYQINNDKKSLFDLVATLMRPKKKLLDPLSPDFDGDIREPFNKFAVDHRAILMSSLSLDTAEAIALNYRGCRNYIIDSFPDIFPKDKPGNKIAPIGPVKPSVPDWGAVIQSMSGGIFGDFEKTEKAKLWTFLKELSIRNKLSAKNKSK